MDEYNIINIMLYSSFQPIEQRSLIMFVKLEQGDIKGLENRNVLPFGAGSLGIRSLEEMDKVGAQR